MFTVPEYENKIEEKRELLLKEREMFEKVKKYQTEEYDKIRMEHE